MPGFTLPGILFLATLSKPELVFLRDLFARAYSAGYRRLVEPAAGALAMSHLARQAGWPAEALEASDVSLFSAIFGYAASGQSLAPLQIEAEGFDAEELLDPATALYAQMICRYARMGEKAHYWAEVVRDLRLRREQVVADLRAQVERARATLGGMSYRTLDLFDHMDEVWDDPTALVALNPPTITAGFERFYDTGGRVRWAEPQYRMFDPSTGIPQLAERARDAKALVVLYEETDYGRTHLPPVFVRGAALKAPGDPGYIRTRNAYLTANRPDEIQALHDGRPYYRPKGATLERAEIKVLPDTHKITPASTLALVPLSPPQAAYYRALWTHRIVGSPTMRDNLGLVIDGYLAGVYGYDRAWLANGHFGQFDTEPTICLQYGMVPPRSTGPRLSRLLTMVALTRESLALVLSPLELSKVKEITSAQITRYPEAKEMRGLMKLASRRPGPNGTYRLSYHAPVVEKPLEAVMAEWWQNEERYSRCRKKQ